MVWRATDPQGEEGVKIRPFIVPYTRGHGVEVGAGKGVTYPHFLGVDDGKDYGGQRVSHIKADACDLKQFATGGLDFVFSSHCLEHVVDYKAALAEWWRVLKVGGHLVLYLPHKDFYPNIGQPGSNPDHKHDFLPHDITLAMMEIAPDWTMIEDEERNDRQEYSFFQVYRREAEGTGQVDKAWKRREKSILLTRYGAFGDNIQAGSVLPGLKAQGWHVTMNTNQRGYDVLRHDPNIDAWLLQDDGQVPDVWLRDFWIAQASRYDRHVNLCESVEQTWLPDSGRISFFWEYETRKKFLDGNYLEFIHGLAQVPMPAKVYFYTTSAEDSAARLKRESIAKGRPLIVMPLVGSSVHKKYPYLPDLIGLLMHNTNVAIATMGDEEAKIYENACVGSMLRSWAKMSTEEVDKMPLSDKMDALRKLPQVKGLWTPLSTVTSIRDSMALAKVADVVFGPETGVVNAVSMMERVYKVVMLSHSSHNNLTRDWPSTIVLTPQVPCYPCHRLHRSNHFCPEDPNTNVALCASALPAQGVFAAIMKALELHQADRGKKVKKTLIPEGVTVLHDTDRAGSPAQALLTP